MVSYFPTPYPDELLYSIIARYHIRSGNTSPKITLRELFNSTTASAILDLPCCIDELSSNLPSFMQLSSDEIILKYTLFPYYAAFLPKNRVNMVLTSMKSNFGGDIHTRTGIMASAIHTPKFIRFCPECNKEDRNLFGEYYWHRQHQVPGVMVCHKHLIPLLDSNISSHGINKHIYISADENNCLTRIMQFDYNKHLSILSQDVKWIFDNYNHISDMGCYREKYLAALKDCGLATSTGRVYQIELMQSFTNYYGNNLLELLQSNIDFENQDNWVSSIVRKHRKAFHPLRHLLMMQFLSGSAERFLNSSYEYKPFGDGPWICLNAAAEHYREPYVKNLEITHCMDTKLPVGTFKCSCGFIYSRRGPDACDLDKYKIGRIKEFGFVWENKLREYVEEKQLSIRETARRLNVDPNTVKKYASILELKNSWNLVGSKKQYIDTKDDSSSSELGTLEDKKLKYRRQWLDTISNNPELTITKLRNISESTYIWLYKNDKIWLVSNTRRLNTHVNNDTRVDWEERDKQLCSQVKKVVKEVLHRGSKPIRITISRIGKESGCLAIIEKHLDKLPITKKFLLDNTESIEEFHKRRIVWAAEELIKNDEELKKWKVIRKAGLRNDSLAEIDYFIDYIIERLESKKLNYRGK